jgi:hypothetical protein
MKLKQLGTVNRYNIEEVKKNGVPSGAFHERQGDPPS